MDEADASSGRTLFHAAVYMRAEFIAFMHRHQASAEHPGVIPSVQRRHASGVKPSMHREQANGMTLSHAMKSMYMSVKFHVQTRYLTAEYAQIIFIQQQRAFAVVDEDVECISPESVCFEALLTKSSPAH
ncbi:hypothetical protein M514_17090 [Trichuris suis]|uniref:Uncharacterized protein n=1 Tax=Trichuris suis TaxID=68888 RepID=A0A085NMC2_9BILA|nr:hypothetical protein M514_17090 [Trichuris suis]